MQTGLRLIALLLVFAGIGAGGEPVAARFSYPAQVGELFRPEWRRDFVRVVGMEPLVTGGGTVCADLIEQMGLAPEIAENYLRNQAAAATSIYRWLRGADEGSYEEAIRRQHRLAAVGPAGTRTYWNNAAPIPYSSEAMSPGIFRAEVARPMFGGDMFQLRAEDLAVLARHGFVPCSWMRPQIRGIPMRHSIITHGFPSGQYSRAVATGAAELAYRRAVVRAAEAVRPLLRLTAEEARGRGEEIARGLAELYYVGIHWMPFDGINNSLLMAQVNVTLRHFGFATMVHGRLDYLALASPLEVFQAVFVEEFRRGNPAR